MTITPWSGDLSAIDNTFGYNDYLIVASGSASLPTSVVDDLSGPAVTQNLSNTANPSNFSTTITDLANLRTLGVDPTPDSQGQYRMLSPADGRTVTVTRRSEGGFLVTFGISNSLAETYQRTGDQLFRLPNGGFLLRRSVFADPCSAGSSRPTNSLLLSHEMSRALAFFGDSYQGGDASGAQWCRRATPGTSGMIETPWDVSTLGGLRNIEQVIERIRAVRAAGANGALPSDIQPAQAALARELARAVPDTELTALATDIRARRERLESAGDMFMRHPVLHTLGIAVLFGLGTDAYHLVRYLVAGGKSPFEGPFSFLGGLRNMIQGIRDFFNRRPPNDPNGGSSGGGGGTNTPPPNNPPPQNAARMSALPDVASGILAFGAGNPSDVNGTVGVPSVGAPTLNPGALPVPAIPVPGAGPVPVVEPVPVVVPRFVPAIP